MGRLSRLLVLALIAGAFASPVRAEVITFEDLNDGDPVPGNYAGLTWEGDLEAVDLDMSAEFPEAPSGHIAVIPKSGASASWQFSSPQVFNGAWFTPSNIASDQQLTFSLYTDGGSTLVKSTSFTLPQGSNWAWYGSGYTGEVDKVVLSSSALMWAMDDISYAPEPCTLALVGLGLVGVGLRRRRPRPRKAREAPTAGA